MDDVKKIISIFVKKPIETINEDTLINKTAIQGSILIHRMYAEIAKLGYSVKDYSEIQTYGQLMNELQPDRKTENKLQSKELIDILEFENNIQIGIDIENISNFAKVNDYREDEFYQQNFSTNEIAYCILQPNPLQCFAGKFAAKEAIFKCNASLKGITFNQIEILNKASGQPYFKNYAISISHTEEFAIAVAALNPTGIEIKEAGHLKPQSKPKVYLYISLLSLLLSATALAFCIMHFK